MYRRSRALARNRMILILSVLTILTVFTGIFIFVLYGRSHPETLLPDASVQDRINAITTPAASMEHNRLLRSGVDRTMEEYLKGNISFEKASARLLQIQQSKHTGLSGYAAEQLRRMNLEEKSGTALTLARQQLEAKDYPKVFELLSGIDPSYSRYDAVSELFDTCTALVLQAVASPESIEAFEAGILLLEQCHQIYPKEAFSARIQTLTEELAVFREISETIQAATGLYDSAQIEEALVLLALGLEKYPDSDLLASTLVDFRDHHIITTTTQAIALCERDRYKDALAIVEAAISDYDCEELQLLKQAIRDESNILLRLKQNLVEAFTSFTRGWKLEEFDVKQAAGQAGAYIIKSGEKLFLGDYSQENVTLLSFGGSIAASLAGVDLLFDLRDLSYDLIHWGEDEYFAVWLAADIVALLPVVGVVKYFSHMKTTARGLDTAADLVDSVGDIGKNTADAASLADTIADITKAGDRITDAVDDARDVSRTAEAAKDALADITKQQTLVETINQHLLGKTHPVTGVPFRLAQVNLSDGRKLKGVFPVFDSVADIQLPEELLKASFKDQQKYCMEQLQRLTKYPWSSLRRLFDTDQLDDIAKGVLPEGLSWHHSEQEGLMQLVDALIHEKTGHTGGMSLWGIGY